MQQLSLLEPRLKEELQIIGGRFRKGGLNSWIVARRALETNIVQSLGMTEMKWFFAATRWPEQPNAGRKACASLCRSSMKRWARRSLGDRR
jgi:hypothetical protein